MVCNMYVSFHTNNSLSSGSFVMSKWMQRLYLFVKGRPKNSRTRTSIQTQLQVRGHIDHSIMIDYVYTHIYIVPSLGGWTSIYQPVCYFGVHQGYRSLTHTHSHMALCPKLWWKDQPAVDVLHWHNDGSFFVLSIRIPLVLAFPLPICHQPLKKTCFGSSVICGILFWIVAIDSGHKPF